MPNPCAYIQYTLYTVHCVRLVYVFRFLHLNFAQHVEVINHFACSREGGEGKPGSSAKVDSFLGAKAKWIFSLLLTQHWSQDWCDICAGSREIWQKYGSPWQLLPTPLVCPAPHCSLAAGHPVCAQKLAMKSSSASRNDISIWKC